MILYYEDGDYTTFEYEPDREELYDAKVEIFAKKYKISEDVAINIIEDLELWDKIEESFEDEINECFREKAFAKRTEDEKYPTDADRYGVKNSWFI